MKFFQQITSQYGSLFPTFPKEEACRTQPEVWEKYWKKFHEQCWATGLSKDQGAIFLKLMSPEGGSVSEATRKLTLDDGSLQSATYDSIYELIRKWCGPKREVLMSTSKQRVENWSRRMGERLEVAHDRFEKYLKYAQDLDSGHTWSKYWQANRIFWYSGLNQKEIDDLYKHPDINGTISDPELIKKTQIKLYERNHLMDSIRVAQSKNHRLNPRRVYVCEAPDEGVEGTPLCIDDLCDDGTNVLSPEHLPSSCYQDPVDDEDLEDSEHVVYLAEGETGLTDSEDDPESEISEQSEESPDSSSVSSDDHSDSDGSHHEALYTDHSSEDDSDATDSEL